ncbi:MULTISPECIES: hypothetical protein [Corynebacterium]|uniref:hypothetical protein n=1 Tax=Corynebacterium TaxID=1716 RepID=UPI001F0C6717|nr:hypothetical protein [Corynebacterium sp. MSK012]MDK8828739.1 hypothetical protein [Corynebacterium sp. MSK012]
MLFFLGHNIFTSKFSEVHDQLRENQPKAKYCIAFEKLMVNDFRTDPTLKVQFDEVYRWSDWKYKGSAGHWHRPGRTPH